MNLLGFGLVGAAIGLAAPTGNLPFLLLCISIGIVGALLIKFSRDD